MNRRAHTTAPAAPVTASVRRGTRGTRGRAAGGRR